MSVPFSAQETGGNCFWGGQGGIFPEKRYDKSEEGDGARNCVDTEVDDCTAVKSGDERENGAPDSRLSTANVAVRLAFPGEKRTRKG